MPTDGQLTTQLKVLRAEQQQLFTRLQNLYTESKKVANPINLRNFQIRLKTLSQTKDRFETIVREINQLELTLDENFNPDFSTIDSFDEILCNIQSVADLISEPTTATSSSRPTNQAGSSGFSAKSISRLPRIPLPVFSGDIKEWPTYFELFKSLIDENQELKTVDKAHYLFGSLSGIAKNICGGLTPTESNYSIVWKALVEKYQDKRKQANAYLEKILKFKTFQIESVANLNSFIDNFDSSVCVLKKLQMTDLGDFILAFVALSKLDPQSRRAFEMKNNTSEIPTYDDVINFVKSHMKVLSHTDSGKIQAYKSNVDGAKSKPQAFMIRDSEKKCILDCHENHEVYQCPKFVKWSPKLRYEFVKKSKLCLNCLSSHKIINCRSKFNCFTCKQRHHSLLHFPTSKPSDSINTAPDAPSTPSICGNITAGDAVASSYCSMDNENYVQNSTVLLSTVSVNFIDRFRKIHKLRFLLDSASQANFIVSRTCKKLNLTVKKAHSVVLGLGSNANSVEGHVKIVVSSQINSKENHLLNMLVIDKVSNNLPNFRISLKTLSYLQELPLADSCFHIPGEIDGILGAEVFASVIGQNKVDGPPGCPTALETSLGYVIIGSAPILPSSIVEQPAYCSVVNLSVEDILQKFWEIEEIEVASSLNAEDVECEKIFTSTVKREPSGRYIVALPFKEEPSVLGDSYTAACRRLLTIEKRLENSPEMRLKYNEAMQNFIAQNHISKISDNLPRYPGYYIPHHGVYKVSSSTPLRIVFDASCKTSTSKSLNDILFAGPKLHSDVFVTLLNFRLFAIAMTADISQMYRQIKIQKSHRRYQRLVWRFSKNEPISVYEISVVAFGVTSSPYLALRTMHQLASDESSSYPLASNAVINDMYVDDFVTSVQDTQNAIKLFQEMVNLCESGGFPIVKWNTNSKVVLKNIPEKIRLNQTLEFNSGNMQSVLGLQWDPESDTLSFKINSVVHKCTKRNILSTIARIFDPLGIIAPVILQAKLMIQNIWILKLGWDDVPPDSVVKLWSQFVLEMPQLVSFKIPRSLGVGDNPITLVAFADASLKAYGGVVYIKTRNNVELLCAKSKVAPLKTVSIPRLELLGVHLLAKLIHKVIETYNRRSSIENIYVFSDSSIALCWIHSSPHRWKTFIANRVTKINEWLPPSVLWFHIPGAENPSDCLSRGLMPSKLIENTLWRKGPDWLILEPENWPVTPFSVNKFSTNLESKVTSLAVTNHDDNSLYRLISNSSSWIRLVRSMVYVLRFSKLLPKRENISSSDLEQAEHKLLWLVQKKHFAKEIELLERGQECSFRVRSLRPFMHNGILRVGGRLSNSKLEFEQCHPVLLPKNDPLVNLLIDYIHSKNLHTGSGLVLALLRQRYWILAARSIVRIRVRNCNRCFRVRPKPTFPIMADLPKFRVQEAKPFVHTGTDYCGPFSITISRSRGARVQKAYICIFICLVTKALHLELASDLSTANFLQCLKRFLSRRGPVSILYSDNGRNYIGSKNELDSLYKLLTSVEYTEKYCNELSHRKIEFRFNTPRTAHQGGIWESQVKCVKSHLFKVVGSQILSYEEMNTLLIQIEALLNSRPLCTLSDDPSDPLALTPAHFLNLTPLQFLPAADLTNESINRLNRYQLIDRLVQSFWARWHLEYLTTLQVRQKWQTKTSDDNVIRPGLIVLIKEDNVAPLQWPLGVIEEIFPNKDGVVRRASVRTKQGICQRPAVRLCPLPSQ
ncbi:uncharacterized protein LOC123291538 [Chrysoperla carnea]|uniref:uncharacterized protein LOC123291538 n=1 Tax=Chrysoperla carnea TaxID=189513 RepID=UPI001D05D029|nr:uncharacterized protein LOC123291538 [Chrysoperla carnea]